MHGALVEKPITHGYKVRSTEIVQPLAPTTGEGIEALFGSPKAITAISPTVGRIGDGTEGPFVTLAV